MSPVHKSRRPGSKRLELLVFRKNRNRPTRSRRAKKEGLVRPEKQLLERDGRMVPMEKTERVSLATKEERTTLRIEWKSTARG